MLRPILIASAATALLQAAAAQSQLHVQQSTSSTRGTYSLTEGFKLAPPISQRVGPITIWDNEHGDEQWYSTGVQFSPGVIQTWTIDDELIDQISLPQGGLNGTEQINGLTLNYCSGVPDPGTGDVLPINLYFYNDYEDVAMGSQSPTGWPVAQCEYMFLLPGYQGISGQGFDCWAVDLDLGHGLECTVPQELTPGGMEPIGVGWTFGDPVASPGGTTGPIIDSVVTNLPGHGALDESRLHTRTGPAPAYNLTMVGNGADFYNSHMITVLAMAQDTEAYYHVDPATQTFDPRAGNTLELQTDVPIRPGSIVTFTVTDADPLMNYTLISSRAPADIARTLTANNPAVEGSLLVDLNLPLVSPMLMAAGTTGPLFVPLGVTQNTMYFQAAEHTGALGLSRITAGSNGLKATVQ